MIWWVEIHEQNGVEERLKAIQKITEIKGAWRAKIYEVFHQIHLGDFSVGVERAKIVLKELETLPNIQKQFLSLIVEDLVDKEKMKELISVAEPFYDMEKHPIGIGVYLVLAYAKLKDTKRAHSTFDLIKSKLKEQKLDQVYQHCEQKLKELEEETK